MSICCNVNLVHGIHVTFRISIDITAKQYTNGISIPCIDIEEIECLQLLLNYRDKERFINKTRENINDLYALLVNNFKKSVYETQQYCFGKNIYCPLRLISLYNFYYDYRLSILEAVLKTTAFVETIHACVNAL